MCGMYVQLFVTGIQVGVAREASRPLFGAASNRPVQSSCQLVRRRLHVPAHHGQERPGATDAHGLGEPAQAPATLPILVLGYLDDVLNRIVMPAYTIEVVQQNNCLSQYRSSDKWHGR